MRLLHKTVLLGAAATMLVGAAGMALATDDHLILTEAVVTPTAGEYIEIMNPTGSSIVLSDYFLTDDMDYALLPGGTQAIGSSDFIVQFPTGYTIAPCQVICIAFDGAGFLAEYGLIADFEMKGTDASTPDMIATDLGATAGLTNSGEHVTLFAWDGIAATVEDVDMARIGTPSATNDIGDKTSLPGYAPDSMTMTFPPGDPGFGFSAERLLPEAGSETSGGGNGISGDDETSEDINTTWNTSAYGPPTPGTVPMSLSTPFGCNPTPVELSTWGAIKKLN